MKLIENIKLGDLRKNIAIVPQEAFLFTSSISENLRFGEPKASLGLIKESATKAGLIDDINNFLKNSKQLLGKEELHLAVDKGKGLRWVEHCLLILQ